MRKPHGNGNSCKNVGCLIIILGIFVLLALILPPTFWWFVLGASLICVGFWLCKGKYR